MIWEECTIQTILQKAEGGLQVTFSRPDFVGEPHQLNIPFFKYAADQFFGIAWDAGNTFYLSLDENRFAIAGKIGGNALIGPVR